jgi:uncharacterized membrane protein YfcA
MPTMLLAAVIGALIGLSLGTLGGGGSILTVPALVYLLGQDPHGAVGSSLMIVGTNALLGAWLHQRAGHVRLGAAVMFGAAEIAAAFGGARLSRLLPGPALLVLFALLMIVIAGLMLRGKAAEPTHADAAAIIWWRVLAGGVGVGFLTGFLGVGGGFLIVPALVLLLGMEMRDAIGSSLVVITINSAAGLLGHLGDGGINWWLIGLLLAGGVPGLLLGARLARRLPAAQLQQGFALFVVLLGVTLLLINVPIALR